MTLYISDPDDHGLPDVRYREPDIQKKSSSSVPSMAAIPTTTIHIARLASRAESSPTPECTSAVPGKYGRVEDYSACNAYYTYNPSFAAAILFSVLFGTLAISHITQAFWYKKKFTWVVIAGVLFELTSFVCRTLGSRDQQNIGLATASQLLFLLAPLCEPTPRLNIEQHLQSQGSMPLST